MNDQGAPGWAEGFSTFASTEVVLSGAEIEPSELSLVRVSDLTSFSHL
ncbi:hypothetical protein [Streptomyces sp. NPDC101150]